MDKETAIVHVDPLQKSLYHLTGEIVELENALETASPEERVNLLAFRDEIGKALEVKVMKYVYLALKNEANLEAIDNMMKKLKDFKEQKKSLIESLKDSLKFGMSQANVKKIEDDIGHFARLQAAAAKIQEPERIDEVPDKYLKKTAKFKPGILDFEAQSKLKAQFGDNVEIEEEICRTLILKDWKKKRDEITSELPEEDREKPEVKNLIREQMETFEMEELGGVHVDDYNCFIVIK